MKNHLWIQKKCLDFQLLVAKWAKQQLQKNKHY